MPPRRPTAPNLADSFRLEDAPGHLLRRNHQRSYDIFTELVGNEGPTRQQVALMVALRRQPGATQNQLAAATSIDRNTLSEMLRRMIHRGLVDRRRAALDSRAYELVLTAQGEDLLVSVMPAVAETQARILEPLPPHLRPVFLHCLKLLAGLEHDVPQASGSPSDAQAHIRS